VSQEHNDTASKQALIGAAITLITNLVGKIGPETRSIKIVRLIITTVSPSDAKIDAIAGA
jgi:hypothetical protein